VADEQLHIPGLAEPEATASAMVKAAHTTLQQLRELGRLEPRHAVLAELILSLADAIDRGKRSGRASAVAMASKELRETVLMLDPPPESDALDASEAARTALREFMDKVERVANGEHVP
jgi:hypothetical protein